MASDGVPTQMTPEVEADGLINELAGGVSWWKRNDALHRAKLMLRRMYDRVQELHHKLDDYRFEVRKGAEARENLAAHHATEVSGLELLIQQQAETHTAQVLALGEQLKRIDAEASHARSEMSHAMNLCLAVFACLEGQSDAKTKVMRLRQLERRLVFKPVPPAPKEEATVQMELDPGRPQPTEDQTMRAVGAVRGNACSSIEEAHQWMNDTDDSDLLHEYSITVHRIMETDLAAVEEEKPEQRHCGVCGLRVADDYPFKYHNYDCQGADRELAEEDARLAAGEYVDLSVLPEKQNDLVSSSNGSYVSSVDEDGG